MAMMAKMRSLAPWFIISVGLIFVVFMILSDMRCSDIVNQDANVIGSVNGEDITYQEFSQVVEQQREQYKAQSGQDIDEEYSDMFNDQVWESLVQQKLIEGQIEKYGISVSGEEINNIIYGPNPPEMLRRQFTDSTGYFNRQLYEQALSQQKNDVLVAVEDQIKQLRLNEKLQSLVLANVNVSEGEIQRQFMDQNTRMNALYILVDAATIPDNSVKVTKEDLKAYYDKHLDKYKVDDSRKVKYVLFSKTANHDDSVSVKNSLASVFKKAKDDTSSFKSYVDIYSELPYSKDTVKQGQLTPEAVNALSGANPGDVIGPVPGYEGYTIFKLISKVPSKETSVRASHILIKNDGDDAKAYAEAMDVYNQIIAGADFAQMAKQKSTDLSNAGKGGDLGWFGKGRMVKPFEEAALGGAVGEVLKPVKTSFGYHVIKVTGKSSNDYVVERIINKVKASATTIENAYTNASDFSEVANDDGFDSQAKALGYKVSESPVFTKESKFVPGVGQNQRLIDFAFDSDVNDVSPVIKTQTGYLVAAVSEVIKPGVRKFEEVQESIKPLALQEKKLEKVKVIADKIAQNIKSKNIPLNEAAAAYKEAKFDTSGVFTPSQGIPTIGRDYAFTDAALHAKVNSVTDPVKGQRGYYIIKVISRNEFDKSAYAIQRNTIRNNMLQEKKSRFLNSWYEDLKKDAEIVDNRWKFYR